MRSIISARLFAGAALSLVLSAGCTSPEADADAGTVIVDPGDAGSGCAAATVGCPCNAGSCTGLVCGADSKCRAAKDCAAAACVTNQVCRPATATTDGTCLPQCNAGFFWNGAAGSCDVIPPSCSPDAGNSVLPTCNAQNRNCAETGSSASCTDCKATFIDVDGGCQAPVTCAQLDCFSQHKNCEELPNGRCTTCTAGYVADQVSGECRTPTQCTSTQCDAGMACVQPTDGTDAFCRSGGCGPTAVLGPDNVCRGCPSCSDASKGEAGPYLDSLSGENRCICRTAPNHFWREGLFPGVTPCDGDNDGWVRESAKLAIESTNPAILTNARCALRTASSVTLENVEGQQRRIVLPASLQLYETDRNDDQQLLTQAVSQGLLPATYGPDGGALHPSEINSLTKLCVDGQSDFNENGLADVNEWQGDPQISTVKALFRPFAEFVHFGELHLAYYSAPDGGSGPGTYVIRERSRTLGVAPEHRVGLQYPAGGDFWRSCTRFRDDDYAALSSAGADLNGVDFAQHAASISPLFEGMNHHSQFKCLRIVNSRITSDPPHWVTAPTLDLPANKFRMNSCALTGVPGGAAVGAER